MGKLQKLRELEGNSYLLVTEEVVFLEVILKLRVMGVREEQVLKADQNL